jgi:uncharacterized membrane protein
MTIFFVLLFVFVLLTVGGGAVLWLAFKRKQSVTRTAPVVEKGPRIAAVKGQPLPFRWRYVVMPALVLLVSVAAAAYFYRLLPQQVAYHGAADGSGDQSVDRAALVLALVAPQFLLAFVAAAVAHIVARVGTRFVQDGSARAPAVESVTTVMSNMVVLPQLVLWYAMMEIFVSAAYDVQLPPLFVFAMAVMLGGGSVLGLFLLRAVQQARVTRG